MATVQIGESNGQQEHSNRASERLHYLDWLRVLAILGVFLYHATLPFSDIGYHIENDERSILVTIFGISLVPWGMSLFFLLAGAGSWFALRRRTGRQYVSERVKRLFIPFIVGTILLSPIQAYIEFIHKGLHRGSFLAFIPTFINERAGPDLHELFSAPIGTYLELLRPTVFGSWGYHLWFLGFLFSFSLIAGPIFLWLRSESGRSLIARLGGIGEKRGGLLLFILLLLLVQLTLRPVFPDLQDWTDFIYYLVFFAFGYILFSNERLLQAIRRDWRLVLIVGIISALSFIVIFGYMMLSGDIESAATPSNPLFFLGWGMYSVSGWCMVIFMMYVGMRFLDFSNKWLVYGREAIVPVYLLHQPIIFVIAFFVVDWQASILLKMLVIVPVSFLATFGLYEAFVRRINPVRALFGMKAKMA